MEKAPDKFPLHVQMLVTQIMLCVVADTFACMLNPGCRGRAFTWAKLPDMARRAVDKQVRLHFKAAQELRYRAEVAAYLDAELPGFVEHLVKDSGVREWLPLPPVEAPDAP